MDNQPNLTQMAADLEAILTSAKSANGAPLGAPASPEDEVTIDAAVDIDANTRVAEVIVHNDTISDEIDPVSGDADAKASLPNEADVGAAAEVVGTSEQNSSRGANLASAESTADSVVAATAVGGGKFEHFPAAPHQQGEFQLPLCDLVIGEKSAGGAYDFDSGAAETLLHAVQTPGNIAPIVVKKTGGVFHVIDGWARVMAYRFQFGNTANILVRVIEWDGSRNDALYDRFASAFLTLKSRKIDKSILLRQFYIAWKVPQQILAGRIGWIESRVTRELAAAEAFQDAPRFAELHVKAGDPPIDYLYKVQQALEAAASEDAAHPKRSAEKGAVAKLEAKLEGLLARPERYATAEALTKLGIVKPAKTKAAERLAEPAGASASLQEKEIIDCVEDASGEAIAMVEMGTDKFPSIRLLVDTTTMDDRRKAEVRHLVHEALDKLFGL